MLKQMKYEHISGKQYPRTAQAEAASRWKCLSQTLEVHSSVLYEGGCLPLRVLKSFYALRRAWGWRGTLCLTWAHSPWQKKVLCKIFSFPYNSGCWIKPYKCGPTMEIPAKGDYLGNCLRFSPVDLHSLGREGSGWRMRCLHGADWGRALGRWKPIRQKTENQKNGKSNLWDRKWWP